MMKTLANPFRTVVGRILALALLIVCFRPEPAQAQQYVKWLAIGSLHEYYVETGANAMVNGAAYGGRWYTGWQWPALWPYNDHQNHEALYIAARDFTDETGEFFPHKVVTQRIFQEPGLGGIYPVNHTLYGRFRPPEVTVDGAETFAHANYVDRIDESIPAEQMVVTTVNTQLGITMRRRDFAWSQEHHDNYHISEVTLTNTGNVDTDPEIELPEQTLEGVYLARYLWTAVNHMSNFAKGSGAHGRYEMNDAIGFGDRSFADELGGEKYRGVFSWDGDHPGFTEWDDIGGPIIRDVNSLIVEGDTTGRISAPGFFGRGILHAPGSVEDQSDDPSQPSTMAWYPGNNTNVLGSNPYDKNAMAREYDFITTGREMPHHADVIVPPEPGEAWIDQMARQPQDGIPSNQGYSSGYHHLLGYGPYTLAPGDSIKIVIFNGINGMDREATLEIGAAFKQAWREGEEDRPIWYDADGDGAQDGDEVMSKTRWVLTGRDSLFQTYQRAMANYESGYDIPQAPRPPSEFHVRSGPDRITLEWDLYEGAQPQGFEIWRAHGEQALWDFEKIAEVGPGERSYEDRGVERGIGYYYHIVAVGDVNNDPTGLTPTGVPLKSSLYYTQTYTPAYLQRPAGENLADARIVPNPYDLGSNPDVRFPDVQDRLAFYDIPEECTIRIYTEMGELIETIEHSGSGDEFWDLTTSSNQVVASGIYIAVIQDAQTGEQVIRKFTIIR